MKAVGSAPKPPPSVRIGLGGLVGEASASHVGGRGIEPPPSQIKTSKIGPCHNLGFGGFYILASSKVTSGWVLTCDSAHSWRLYGVASLRYHAADTMRQLIHIILTLS